MSHLLPIVLNVGAFFMSCAAVFIAGVFVDGAVQANRASASRAKRARGLAGDAATRCELDGLGPVPSAA